MIPYPTVLVVDDVTANRETLLELLDSKGYRIVEAASGPEALKLATESPPDLVLLDVMMPGMDGYEVCRRLRAEAILAEVPVIMITALDDEMSRLAGIEAGADDFITKPFHGAELRARVRTILRLNHYRRLMGAQERIHEQATLLDQAREAIIVTSLDDSIIYWNKGAENTFGWSSGEVLGRRTFELLNVDPAKYKEVRETLAVKDDWQGELVKTTKDGRQIIVEVRCTMVRNIHGQPKSILAINTDVTEKKQLEAQLLRTQRLESIGTLASGIAHDLNNILAPILMASSLLREETANANSLSLLNIIESSAERGTDIVKQVLTFGRGVQGERVLLDPKHLLRDVTKMAKGTFPKTINIVTRTSNDLWPILGDRTQLHQVILNLCVNARDAIGEHGTITLALENVVIEEAAAQPHSGAKAGPHVVLEVRDSGSGIPPEVIEKIFDPFFTTKELGKGTGLGLSTVLGIVKSHGGWVNVESEVGRGTTFRVSLPASPDAAPKQADAEAGPIPRGNGELILVVDDEASIRTVTETMLTRHGYRVVMARDGTEAIAVFVQHRREIRLVSTDVMMPQMDGVALVRVLKRLEPTILIVATSGLGSTAPRKSEELKELGVQHFLTKPFVVEKLLSTLGQILSSQTEGAP